MTSGLIAAARNGRLCAVTLDRPHKANALTQAMLRDLRDIFVAMAAEDIRVLTLTGAGERAFCAGADLSELSRTVDDPANALWDEMAAALHALPVLTIACVNGACIGGGLTLALNCDIRLGVPDAQFGYPALRNAVLPSARDGARLNALIGPGRTSLLLLAGTRISAVEAVSWGLVDQLVARDRLMEAAKQLSQVALAADAPHLAALKQSCRSCQR